MAADSHPLTNESLLTSIGQSCDQNQVMQATIPAPTNRSSRSLCPWGPLMWCPRGSGRPACLPAASLASWNPPGTPCLSSYRLKVDSVMD